MEQTELDKKIDSVLDTYQVVTNHGYGRPALIRELKQLIQQEKEAVLREYAENMADDEATVSFDLENLDKYQKSWRDLIERYIQSLKSPKGNG